MVQGEGEEMRDGEGDEGEGEEDRKSESEMKREWWRERE